MYALHFFKRIHFQKIIGLCFLFCCFISKNITIIYNTYNIISENQFISSVYVHAEIFSEHRTASFFPSTPSIHQPAALRSAPGMVGTQGWASKKGPSLWLPLGPQDGPAPTCGRPPGPGSPPGTLWRCEDAIETMVKRSLIHDPNLKSLKKKLKSYKVLQMLMFHSNKQTFTKRLASRSQWFSVSEVFSFSWLSSLEKELKQFKADQWPEEILTQRYTGSPETNHNYRKL